jgi:hypothetical protein
VFFGNWIIEVPDGLDIFGKVVVVGKLDVGCLVMMEKIEVWIGLELIVVSYELVVEYSVVN